MSNPLTYVDVWKILDLNQQWSSVCGPTGEPPLTSGEKRSICALVTIKLKKCFENNGDQFHSEVLTIMKRALATNNWYSKKSNGEYWLFSKGGIFILVNGIYKKASRLALQKIDSEPKLIAPIMAQVVSERFF